MGLQGKHARQSAQSRETLPPSQYALYTRQGQGGKRQGAVSQRGCTEALPEPRERCASSQVSTCGSRGALPGPGSSRNLQETSKPRFCSSVPGCAASSTHSPPGRKGRRPRGTWTRPLGRCLGGAQGTCTAYLPWPGPTAAARARPPPRRQLRSAGVWAPWSCWERRVLRGHRRAGPGRRGVTPQPAARRRVRQTAGQGHRSAPAHAAARPAPEQMESAKRGCHGRRGGGEGRAAPPEPEGGGLGSTRAPPQERWGGGAGPARVGVSWPANASQLL